MAHRIADEIARSCFAVWVRMLNRVITQVYDDALRPLGFKVSQLNILVVAARLGKARPADMCDILQMDASTVGPMMLISWRLIDRLSRISEPRS